ncbi:hypothetical protein LTR84_005786 [Exophiala bonariae]|uniref:(S)-ureidoglycine aminohydrolase cupin domain-containing protein n=1 Tax=Exophiala bonariae TaxID=1690606 RepID=A0AAV9N3D6_9EURO|nr:hypothetical protein LTR84_005786 [Exophiala bonariae]
MPSSTPNTTGSADPSAIPYGTWDSFPREPFEMYNGWKSIYYRSENNKIAVGAIHEIGEGHLTWPEDEFLIVTKGWIKFQIQDGEDFELKQGDIMFMKQGQVIDFQMSDDFTNIAVFISEDKVSII